MKKESISKLFLLLMSIIFIPTVLAANYDIKYEVVADTVTEYKPGDKVVVELRVKEASELIDSTSVAVEYDPEVLSLEKSDVVDNRRSGYMNTIAASIPLNGRVAYAVLGGGVYVDGDYLLISTLTFTVKDNAKGSTKITARTNQPVDVDNNFLSAEGNEITIKFKTPLKSISLNSPARTVGVGQNLIITPGYEPSDTTDDKTLSWTSSDDKVATVSDGVVTGVAPGRVEITATSAVDGVRPATVTIGVVSELQKISLNKSKLEFTKDEFETLKVNFEPTNYTTSNVTIEWTSSDSNVASVKDGLVTAKNYGTATITAKAYSDGVELKTVPEVSCEVEVVNHVTGIKLDKSNEKLVRGETLNLTATLLKQIENDDTTDKGSITWSASNSNVEVSDGVVRGISRGTSVVTASFNGYMASMTVEVIVPVQGISIGNDITIRGQEEKTLEVVSNPVDADQYNVTWISGNNEVATVENGVVKGVKPGETTITARVNEKIEASIIVTVLEIPLETITIENGNDSIELEKGKTKNLEVSYTPDNATNKTISWTSSDDTVASVKDGVVTAHKSGEVEITAQNGDTKDTITIHVTIPLEGIQFNDEKVTMNKGDSKTLEYSLKPNDTTNQDEVKITSSDESIVSVDNNGTVTALKTGTVTITIQKGDKNDTLEVEVKSPLKAISADDLEIKKGECKNIVLEYLDEDTTDTKEVTYKVLDESIVSVDEKGLVTALKVGTTTITITSKVEGVSPVTINVTVPRIALTGIKVSTPVTTLLVGDDTKLSISYLTNENNDETTDNIDISYESSDESVVVVENGFVTAKGLGKATVTVYVNEFTKTLEFEVVEPTITKVEYPFKSGADSNITDGDLEVVVDAEYEYFESVYVDYKLVSSDNYTTKSGSTVVTLKDSFLDTLEEGLHYLTIKFKKVSGTNIEEGEATTTFTINRSKPTTDTEINNQEVNTDTLNGSVKTGDTIMSYVILFIVCITGLITEIIYYKKIARN